MQQTKVCMPVVKYGGHFDFGGPGSGRHKELSHKVELDTSHIKNENHLKSQLLDLSKDGNAYVAFVVFGDTAIYKYNSPSQVHDGFMDRNPWGIAYKGKFVPFSQSAQLREQKRAYSGDR